MKKLILLLIGGVILSSTLLKAKSTGNNNNKLFSSVYDYVEYGCITNNCAGTKCVSGRGTCKKARTCTPVIPNCNTGYLASNTVTICTDYADQMVEEEYIDQQDWQASYQVCIESIYSFLNP